MRHPLHSIAAAVVLGVLAPSVWAASAAQKPASAPATPAAEQPAPADKAAAQAPTKSADTPYYTLKTDSTLVNVEVLVTDEDGRVLSGLKKGNFRILDNGVPQKILNFSPTAEPITIVLMLEYSSLSYSYFATKAAWWGTSFLNHLEPEDWVALVTYDMRPKVRVDFTHRIGEVRETLATLGPPQFSESNMFDALADTLDQLDRVRGKTAILLLSTGRNTFSGATLDETLARLRRTDAKIFCVGLAEQEFVRYGGSAGGYLMSKNWLTTFSKMTGGVALFPRFEGELPEIFRGVVGFLRNEYSLSYRPPRASRDGRYHRLKVEIVGPDGKPLKVTNEKGKRRKIEVYAREGYTAPKD